MRLPIWHAPLFDLIDSVNEMIENINKKKNPNEIENPNEWYPQIKLIDYFYNSVSKLEFQKKGMDGILPYYEDKKSKKWVENDKIKYD